MKFIDLIPHIRAGETIVVYTRKAFQQIEDAIYWGSVGGCFTDLHTYFNRLASIQTYSGYLCIILED